MHNEPKVMACQPGQGEAFTIAEMVFYLRASGSQTHGRYSLMEVSAQPGAGLPLHRQSGDVIFFVLEGECAVQAGEEHHGGGPGFSICIPAGQWYTFRNAGQGVARVAVTAVPAGIEAFYRDVGHVVIDRATPPMPLGEDDHKRMVAAGHKHGVEFR